MELQVRIGREYQYTVGLSHSRIVDELGLEHDSLKQLLDIGEAFELEAKELIEPYAEDKKDVKEFLVSRLAEILNEEQHQIYAKYAGHRLRPVNEKNK